MPEVKLFVPIGDIVVDHERSNSQVKDLAESILMLDQIQPIVIDQYSRIVAGRRRLAALKMLGRTEAWVTVADTGDDKLRAILTEGHENTCREPLTPWDALESYDRILAIHREAAAERRGAKGHAKNAKPGSKPGLTIVGEARQLAAKAVGRGKDTLIMLHDIQEALGHENAAVREVAEAMRDVLRKPDGNVKQSWQQVQDVLKEVEEGAATADSTAADPPDDKDDEEAQVEAALDRARKKAAAPTPAPMPKMSRQAVQIQKISTALETFAQNVEEFAESSSDVDWKAFFASFDAFVASVEFLRQTNTKPQLSLVKGKKRG